MEKEREEEQWQAQRLFNGYNIDKIEKFLN